MARRWKACPTRLPASRGAASSPFNLLGVGIGLSLVDPMQGTAPKASSFGLGAGLWLVVSSWTAMVAGGFVASRLAGSYRTADGVLHGLVVWAFTLALAVYLFSQLAGSAIGGAANLVGSAASTAAQAAAQSPAVASLLQSSDVNGLSPDQAQAAVAQGIAELMANPADAGQIRDRLVRIISAKAGISPDEARARLQAYETRAREAADTAARAATRATLWGFVALVVGGIAATLGGWLGIDRRPMIGLATERL